MNIFSPGVKKEPLHKGYRLVRRERLPEQPVVLIGPYYGELGHECFGYQDQVRSAVRRKHAEGKHVVVAGFVGRHPMYELADEYWGTTEYEEAWTGYLDCAKNMFGTVEHMEITSTKLSSGELALVKDSDMASGRAEEILKDGPVILVMTRHRNIERCRNMMHWPHMVQALSGLPGVRIISTALRGSSFTDPGMMFMEDFAGAANMMDLEIAMHKRAICTVSSDSGCQCIPLLSGARNLVIFSGMFPPHVDLYEKMNAKYPGYCNLHICSTAFIVNLNISEANRAISFVSENYEKWKSNG